MHRQAAVLWGIAFATSILQSLQDVLELRGGFSRQTRAGWTSRAGLATSADRDPGTVANWYGKARG